MINRIDGFECFEIVEGVVLEMKRTI